MKLLMAIFGPTFMSIAYVVLKLEREGQSDPPPVLPFTKKPSLGRVKSLVDAKYFVNVNI